MKINYKENGTYHDYSTTETSMYLLVY